MKLLLLALLSVAVAQPGTLELAGVSVSEYGIDELATLSSDDHDGKTPVILVDVSTKHARIISKSIKKWLEPDKDFKLMSLLQSGGPDVTRRRLEALMEFEGSNLAMPFGIMHVDRTKTSGHKLLCQTIPQKPHLQARTFVAAGNQLRLNALMEECRHYNISVDRVQTVGSCVRTVSPEVRYMRVESGYTPISIKPEVPRPDVFVCITQLHGSLDTSQCTVLAAAYAGSRQYNQTLHCGKNWDGHSNTVDVPEAVRLPHCDGRATVIDL